MIKNSLTDILYQQAVSETNNPARSKAISEIKNKKVDHYDHKYNQVDSTRKKNSKFIKITQFNSSLLIGDQKLVHNTNVQSANSSPNKNFNIKKVNEFKNKVMSTAQKTVEIQLKKKEQQTNMLSRPKSPVKTPRKSFSQKRSIDKILVATKCSVKNQLPSYQQMLDDKVDIFGRRGSVKRLKDLNDVLHMQKLQCSPVFKDLLAQTNQSLQEAVKKLPKQQFSSVELQQFLTQQIDSPLLNKVSSPSPRRLFSKHILEQKKYQQKLQQEKKQMLQMKKQLNKNYAKPFNPPQNISAQAYIVYQTDLKKIQYNKKVNPRKDDPQVSNEQRKMLINSHKVVVSLNPRVAVEVASLTKIMTCILTLQISKKFQINLEQQQILVGMFQQNIGGTSAQIKKGEIYTVEQLLYGLMLPSGNDASLALAVWGGRKLLQNQTKVIQCEQALSFSKKECYSRFLEEMNSKAVELNMQKTRYANSHGLANFDNKSCPFDIAILSEYAMSNSKFRQIVSTKRYQCNIRSKQDLGNNEVNQEKDNKAGRLVKKDSLFDSSDGLLEQEQMKDTQDYNQNYQDQEQNQQNARSEQNKAAWQNTHLLLQNKSDLYVGIKTGVTVNAGPCLASCVQYNNRRFIIVVLNCKTMKYRFKDTENLRKWLFGRQDFKYKEKEKKNKQQA